MGVGGRRINQLMKSTDGTDGWSRLIENFNQGWGNSQRGAGFKEGNLAPSSCRIYRVRIKKSADQKSADQTANGGSLLTLSYGFAVGAIALQRFYR